MGQILLVRHGQASFGAADYDNLSEIGREQSRLLGEWFERCGQRVDQVWMGSLRRHRQTAAACLAAMNGDVPASGQWCVDAGLDEFDHKEVMARFQPEQPDVASSAGATGKLPDPKREFQEMFALATAHWMAAAHDAQYREPWPAFHKRCTDAIGRLAAVAPVSGNILVFTSGGTIAAICRHLLGLSDEQTARVNWTLVNSGITRVLYQRPSSRMTLTTLNSYPHLECTGRRELVTHR
jgi:broad specificity phosphatase PhoE